MSTIYKNLVKDEPKLQRKQPALVAPEIYGELRLTGIKFALGMALVFSLGAIAFSTYLHSGLQKEQNERASLEAAQIQFRERTQTLELESDKYRAEITKISEQFKTVVQEKSNLKKEIDSGRILVSNLEKNIRNLEQRMVRSVEDPEFEPVGDVLPQASGVVPVRISPVSSSGARPVSLNAPVSEGQPVVAKQEVPVEKKAQVAPVPVQPVSKTNQIMTVNRKFNFVVVNVGMKDQIKIGDHLVVRRANKDVGRIQVEKLYDNFAAATILEESKNAPIKEGDSILKA